MSNGPMPERILVVEDDEIIRDLIVSILASAGYDCRQAADGQEALDLIESGEPFDLILSNFMMPKLNGHELLTRVKAKHPDLPFVIHTANQDPSVRVAVMRDGAYDFVPKPFQPDQLLSAVRRVLEYRRLTLENRSYQTNLEQLVTARTDQLRQAVTGLERAYDAFLDFIGDAIELKDTATGSHSKRVTTFAIAIARDMALPPEQIRVVARAGFLHDIGKLALPDAILLKPTALTGDEMAAMRQHCSTGYEILKKVTFLAEAAELVYAHHERYDGTGYPRGLKAEQIPLGARIVAVANTLDAITSDLRYRRARSVTAAREEIRRCSGIQFDPGVVNTFLTMPEHIWGDLRAEIEKQN